MKVIVQHIINKREGKKRKENEDTVIAVKTSVEDSKTKTDVHDKNEHTNGCVINSCKEIL